MSFPVADEPFNPNVEVKEVDDREWDETGQLVSGGVRQVVLVDGEEYRAVSTPGHHLETSAPV